MGERASVGDGLPLHMDLDDGPTVSQVDPHHTRRDLLIAALHIGSNHEHHCRASVCEWCAQEADRLIACGVFTIADGWITRRTDRPGDRR